MSSSKGQLREQIAIQIRRLAAGGTASNFKFDTREIELAMNQTRDSLVRNHFYQRYAAGDMNVDLTYVHEFKNVPAVLDEDTNEFVSVLPCDVISLPNGREVYQVRPMKDSKFDFIPVRPNFNSMYRNDGDVPLESRKGYYKVGGSIHYVNVDKMDMPCKMLMRLVSAGADIPDNSEYIGGELEEELTMRVMSRLMPSVNKVEDKSNNQMSS